MKLYIANLSPNVTHTQLQQLLAQFGQVLSMEISWIEKAGRTAGSAVIEMEKTQSLAVLKGLNGQAFHSRRLYISPLSYAASMKKNPATEEAFKKASAAH